MNIFSERILNYFKKNQDKLYNYRVPIALGVVKSIYYARGTI